MLKFTIKIGEITVETPMNLFHWLTGAPRVSCITPIPNANLDFFPQLDYVRIIAAWET